MMKYYGHYMKKYFSMPKTLFFKEKKLSIRYSLYYTLYTIEMENINFLSTAVYY